MPIATQPGAAMIVWNSRGQLLMGRRRSVHGYKTWALPGGLVEPNERPIHAAERETWEETGLIVWNIRAWAACPSAQTATRRTYFFESETAYTPMLREPDQHFGWRWFDPWALPSPLFPPNDPRLLRLGPWWAW